MSAILSSSAEVAQGQDQHAEHAVGAVDQRQALLGGQLDRGRCRARRAPAAGRGLLAVRRRRPRPRPSAPARRATSGARSPEQPSEPYSRTAGVTPALSSAAMVSATTGRTPVCPVARVFSRISDQRADHLGLDQRAHPGGVRADQRALQLRRAARGRCAGWPARRSRWRCRRPGSGRRPAGPPRRGRAASASSAGRGPVRPSRRPGPRRARHRK